MVAKSLTKLIDEAIIPALLLVIVKVVGVLAAAYFLKLNYEVSISVFPKVSFATLQDYVLAENYSNLAMFTVAATGSLVVLIRAHFLHETHVSPKIQQKLARLNLENIVKPSYHLYHQAAIWLTFVWLTTGFLIISTVTKITYMPITIIAFLIAINFSWIMARDIEMELNL